MLQWTSRQCRCGYEVIRSSAATEKMFNAFLSTRESRPVSAASLSPAESTVGA